MALLTGILSGGPAEMLCATANASPLSGMVTMYMLMSAFHAAPWLKLIRASAGGWSEQLAQQRDLHGEIAFLDDRAGPCCLHQLGFAQDFAGPSGERRKQHQSAIADGNRGVVPKRRAHPWSSTNGPKANRDPCIRRIYRRFGTFGNYLALLKYAAVRVLQSCLLIPVKKRRRVLTRRKR